MAKRLYALVKPKLLTWARESASFSVEQVAESLHLKADRIIRWEMGDEKPTIPQLRKLADLYHRPIAVFYLPEKPKDFQPLHDFRRIRTQVESQPRNYKIQLQIRQAHYRRDIAIELTNELQGELPTLKYEISLIDNPEEIGKRIRDILNISYENQLKASNPNVMFKVWRTALENAGVLVFQVKGIPVEDMRGFSISEYPLPVIVINSRDSSSGKVFTLLHEFAHIMLHKSGMCDLDESNERKKEDNDFEVFCNHIAGATLLPKEILLSEELVTTEVGKVKANANGFRNIEWTNEQLTYLAQKKFKVSREVVLRRLLTFNMTSLRHYQVMRDEFNRQAKEFNERKEEPDEEAGEKKKRFAPPAKIVLSNVSLPFVRLVLESYHQQIITARDLSDYLDVRLKQLPKIELEIISRTTSSGSVI